MEKLSICIPAYNYAHYLPQAIDSCLSQDVDFSLIVLDNASSDSTPDLRDKYNSDSRVQWFRNESTIPVQANWNKVVSLASSKWIKLLQADDKLIENSLKRIFQLIDLNPALGYIGHLSEIIDVEGVITRKHSAYSSQSNVIYLSPNEGPPLILRNMARLREPTSNLFTKEAWTKVGGYSEKFRFVFDINFNYNLIKNFDGMLVSEYFSQVRRHKSSDGATLPPQTGIDELKDLVHRISSDLSDADQIQGQSLIQYRIVELFLQRYNHNPKAAIKFLFLNRLEFLKLRSLPPMFRTMLRRFSTGDVQQSFKEY